MSKTIARPNKQVGRVILGPRQVAKGCARIVACENGDGLIELYNPATGLWCDGSAECTFSELWSGLPVQDPISDAERLKVA